MMCVARAWPGDVREVAPGKKCPGGSVVAGFPKKVQFCDEVLVLIGLEEDTVFSSI